MNNRILSTEDIIMYLELLEVEYIESAGFYAAFISPQEKPEIIFMGLKDYGIIAQYNRGLWCECKLHGNFGKRYACGGAWSVTKKGLKNPPEIVQEIVKSLLQNHPTLKSIYK